MSKHVSTDTAPLNCGLPTEAEWEFAARAESDTIFHWGDDAESVDRFAVFIDNSNGQPAPVRSKDPNAFGLHDTAGNVWEWVQDCYHENYQDAPIDGKPFELQDAESCEFRVLRGGSFNSDQFNLRSSYREPGSFPQFSSANIGFRVVCRPH